jgi:murein DD-endopeptidase MepM/ murein hydrolase activator NlpD
MPSSWQVGSPAHQRPVSFAQAGTGACNQACRALQSRVATADDDKVRRWIVASILIGLAAALLTSPVAWGRAGRAHGSASGTGGSAYEPRPDRKPVNPGRNTGETGGASYVPRSEQPAEAEPPATAPGGRIDKDLRSAVTHRFPVGGKHSLGGADARFGAPRPGHRHQGQDIIADEGTPVVAPRGGTVVWRAFQAKGAGYYLVVEGVAEPYAYVFMHLQRGSLQAKVGDRVRTGQLLAAVGSTGTADGPHLHFEIWRGRWGKGGQPIDPLPYLLVWDAVS